MFEQFDPNSDSASLVDAIVVDDSGLEIVPESIKFEGAEEQTSFYDGSLEELGIGAGVLFTSGEGNPPTENTSSAFSKLGLGNTDEQLQAVVDSAFEGNGGVQDANTLEFSFNVSDPDINSITFDLLFGSDEYPEYSSSSYVDVGAVFVNDKNVALFNNEETQPLTIIDDNLDAGNFLDNSGNTLPIEYDGISSVLTISAPVNQGENTIKFGVADTGDQSFDSGLFISNLSTSKTDIGNSGSGVLIDTPGSNENDDLTGTDNDDFIEVLDGDDIVNAGKGSDLIEAGAGDDKLRAGDGNDILNGDIGDDILNGGQQFDNIFGGEGNDVLIGNDGTDILNGGEGNDLFYLQGNVTKTDWIQDFNLDDDRIGLADGLTQDNIEITGEANSFINYNGSQVAVLLGVNPNDLMDKNFQEF